MIQGLMSSRPLYSHPAGQCGVVPVSLNSVGGPAGSVGKGFKLNPISTFIGQEGIRLRPV